MAEHLPFAPDPGDSRGLGLGDFHLLLPRGRDLHPTGPGDCGNSRIRTHRRRPAFRYARCGVRHSSQPNISRPGGCRHPLLRHTSIRVYPTSHHLQRCKFSISSGLFQKNRATPRQRQHRSRSHGLIPPFARRPFPDPARHALAHYFPCVVHVPHARPPPKRRPWSSGRPRPRSGRHPRAVGRPRRSPLGHPPDWPAAAASRGPTGRPPRAVDAAPRARAPGSPFAAAHPPRRARSAAPGHDHAPAQRHAPTARGRATTAPHAPVSRRVCRLPTIAHRYHPARHFRPADRHARLRQAPLPGDRRAPGRHAPCARAARPARRPRTTPRRARPAAPTAQAPAAPGAARHRTGPHDTRRRAPREGSRSLRTQPAAPGRSGPATTPACPHCAKTGPAPPALWITPCGQPSGTAGRGVTGQRSHRAARKGDGLSRDRRPHPG